MVQSSCVVCCVTNDKTEANDGSSSTTPEEVAAWCLVPGAGLVKTSIKARAGSRVMGIIIGCSRDTL